MRELRFAGQLTTAPLKNASTNALIKQYTFGYDTASNRTSETVATTTTTSTPNNVNAITSQSGGVNRTLTYDLNGNLTSDGGTRTFQWDGANRLVAINYTGFTTRSEFAYDGLSRMVKIVEKTGATINSTRKFVWAGQEKAEFRDAADAVTMRIFPQGQHNGTTPYFFTRDHLGSVREVLSGGGTVVARYDYDPYGRSTTILGTTPTDVNFTGLYRHSKSNLNLAVYRAHDPDLGRWLNRDPLEDAEIKEGPNLYAYVRNHPISSWDPDGLAEAPAGTGVPTRSWGFTRHEGLLTFIIRCPAGKKVANVRAHYDLLVGALGPDPDPGTSTPYVPRVNCEGAAVRVEMPMRTRYTSLIFGNLQYVRFYVDFTSLTYDCVACCP